MVSILLLEIHGSTLMVQGLKFSNDAQLLVCDSRLFAGAIQTAVHAARARGSLRVQRGGRANEFISLKSNGTQNVTKRRGGAR